MFNKREKRGNTGPAIKGKYVREKLEAPIMIEAIIIKFRPYETVIWSRAICGHRTLMLNKKLQGKPHGNGRLSEEL